jgi:hypothetical protein
MRDPQTLQLVDHELRCVCLFERELGMVVKHAPEHHQVRVNMIASVESLHRLPRCQWFSAGAQNARDTAEQRLRR